jgi:trehalose/maltose hydrolase-like predicted phosphorylase
MVLVGDEFVSSPSATAHIADARRLGAAVAIVTTRPLSELGLGLPHDGAAGPLVVAASDGREREVDDAGVVATLPPDNRDPMSYAVDELAARGMPPSETAIVDEASVGPDGLAAAVADQVERRQRGELPTEADDPEWWVSFDDLDPTWAHLREAVLTLADGRVGTSGAPIAHGPGFHRWVVAGGVYNRDGADGRLLSGPVGLQLPYELGDHALVHRALDLRAGVLHERLGSGEAALHSVRFASLARPGLVVMRARCPDVREGPMLLPPAEDAVFDQGVTDDAEWMRAAGASGGIAAAASETATVSGRGLLVDRTVAYEADPHLLPDASGATARARAASGSGFDRLLAEQRSAWAERWADADITIEGDQELQTATRFALFHLMASVPDSGEAAVGARGLTGPGYRGHVFWDADTFTLPFLAATHPAAARAMLEYRLRRLPAALDAARAMGRAGARFPWESARTGRDVTPTSALDRRGRTVLIRTGSLEEHIVAQVAWAACQYAAWTGDVDFAQGPLLRLLVETARYWSSRIRVDNDGAGHIFGVIGPDEYHEPVDDNAFTNVMARWNLRTASEVVAGPVDAVGDLDQSEVATWGRLADALVDGYDADTGVYEQFAGFNGLEPLRIAEVAPRRPITADLLLGRERVHAAQVVKQADVLMLHHMLPDEVAPGSLEPNLRFYEPRTAHGSSLSPGVHASLFARSRDYERALPALRIAARMDLDDLTETTSAGLHLATMGSLWQAFAFGFAGLRPLGQILRMDPRLPPDWSALEIRVRFRGSRVRMRRERASLVVEADPPVDLLVGATACTAGPGPVELRRRGAIWEVTT